MDTAKTFVIIGAGLTGAKAAETLRGAGFDGRIALIGNETDRPYERPPLSKGFLAGTKDRESVFVHPAEWYEQNSVDLRLGAAVTSIDPAGKAVGTEDGESIGYDKLLIATGATPRRLALPGGDRAFYLRWLGDSERLRDAISTGGRVVVVGGGWIGLECAAAAKGYGAEVTVIEPMPAPLHAVLGPELGGHFAAVHRKNGVDVRVGSEVTEITPDAVLTKSGDSFAADVVIVGVGARPNVELAEAAGLAVDNGILVDASLRTSDPDIYAAGDVANAEHPGIGGRIRVEHWANALNQGKAAGLSMLGQGAPYDRVPYFFTDQFELGMEYSGYVAKGGYDRVVYRGSVESGEFIAFWLQDGLVRAGMNVNVWDVIDPIQALIRAGWSGTVIDPIRLADPNIALDTLI